MTHITHTERAHLRLRLDDIIAAHGFWPVLRALMARMLRRKARLPELCLNDHLRRDIGLGPLPPSAFPPGSIR